MGELRAGVGELRARAFVQMFSCIATSFRLNAANIPNTIQGCGHEDAWPLKSEIKGDCFFRLTDSLGGFARFACQKRKP